MILTGEGRYELGCVDDYQIWLGEHGDMLFRHNMVGKRCFYEESAKVPLILAGELLLKWRGKKEKKLAQLSDVMPTLLALCNLPIPDSVEGIPLLSEKDPGETRDCGNNEKYVGVLAKMAGYSNLGKNG